MQNLFKVVNNILYITFMIHAFDVEVFLLFIIIFHSSGSSIKKLNFAGTRLDLPDENVDYGDQEIETIIQPPSFEELSGQLPIETEKQSPLTFCQLVSINNKTELLLYGGQINDKIFDGIYKFSLVTKIWMKVGKMIFPRAAHTVTPVQGLTCP